MMAGLNSPDMQNPVKLAKGVQRAKDYAIGHYKRVMQRPKAAVHMETPNYLTNFQFVNESSNAINHKNAILSGILDLDEEENVIGLIRKKVLGKEGSQINDLLMKLGCTGYDMRQRGRGAQEEIIPKEMFARTQSNPPQSGNKSQMIKHKIDMIRMAHSQQRRRFIQTEKGVGSLKLTKVGTDKGIFDL